MTKARGMKGKQLFTSNVAKAYRKSVSKSLVYKSLKIDGDGYAGFKVTFSGKGRPGNYNKSRVSVILIPELSLIRGYRPIAGAIARVTKGEVYTCSYSDREGVNDRIISLVIDRSSYIKSKIRQVDIISQNAEILRLIKERLAAIDRLSDSHCDRLSIETPDLVDSVSNINPKNETHRPHRRRNVTLIKVNGKDTASEPRKSGFIASVLGTVVSKIGRMFKSPEKSLPETHETADSIFDIQEKSYNFDKKLKFDDHFHCDIIAKGMLGQ
jgi:hypothetical protein